MSKQDSHFFNIFGLVLGILIAVALVLFGVARAVGRDKQLQSVHNEDMFLESVAVRIAPPVRVAVAGADNSALAIVATTEELAGPGLPIPADAAALYEAACKTCHGAGIGGAPMMGDAAAWNSRIAQGNDVLYEHAINGYIGEKGAMPAKGGRSDIPDDLIRAGVDYMVGQSR